MMHSSTTPLYDETLAQAWLGRPRILVAEDDEDLATGLRWMLSPSYAVSTQCSALGTLRSCRTELPDLLIIDYELPDVTGVELLQLLSNSTPVRVPAIMISAYQDRAGYALQNGFEEFLAKPVPEARLREAIRRAMGV